MDTYVCKRCENTGTCIVSLLEALIKHSTMADIKASEKNVIFMKILQLTFSNVWPRQMSSKIAVITLFLKVSNKQGGKLFLRSNLKKLGFNFNSNVSFYLFINSIGTFNNIP